MTLKKKTVIVINFILFLHHFHIYIIDWFIWRTKEGSNESQHSPEDFFKFLQRFKISNIFQSHIFLCFLKFYFPDFWIHATSLLFAIKLFPLSPSFSILDWKLFFLSILVSCIYIIYEFVFIFRCTWAGNPFEVTLEGGHRGERLDLVSVLIPPETSWTRWTRCT